MINITITNPFDTFPEISLAGHVTVDAPNCHFPRICSDWILYFIVAGHMKLVENDIVYDLLPGSVLFLSPGKEHHGIRVPADISYYYIHFHWQNLFEKTDSIEISKPQDNFSLPKHFVLSPDQTLKIGQSFEQLEQEFASEKPFASKRLTSLFVLLLTDLHTDFYFQKTSDTARTNTLSYSVYYYLREHCCEKISSSTLEKVFHHNFNYMNRLFKKTFSVTIFDYLASYRIQSSKTLLKSGYYSISQVAEKLGFCNAFYFSKVFKKYTQLTPSQYRDLE